MDPWQSIQSLSRREIRRLQDHRLRRFIREYLYPFSPHYRRLFQSRGLDPDTIEGVEDLRRIPLTSKADFVSDTNEDRFRDFILSPDQDLIRRYWPWSKRMSLAWQALRKGTDEARETVAREFRPVFLTFTTGTTGRPVSYVYTHRDMENLALAGHRMMRVFQIPSSDHIVNMFPYAPHLAFWQVVFGGLAARALVMSTGGGKVMGTEGNLASLMKMRPSVIVGVPGYVYHVLRLAAERKSAMPFVEKVILGAGRVSEGFKEKVRDLLYQMGAKSVAVLGTYGFTEARTAWAECPSPAGTSSGYHLYPDKEIFEIIDPKTGEPKGEGEDGEIVYTAIDARGSVVIRYRTGDYVKGGITTAPCPYCRRTVPRLSSDITRMSNIKDLRLSKIKGSLVNLNTFSRVLSGLPEVEEWQVEIRKKNDDPYDIDELILYICPSGRGTSEKVAEHIRQTILRHTEVAPNEIHMVSMSEILERIEMETAGKAKRIIDKRRTE